MIKTMWLASMLWPDGIEPLCVGTDRKKVETAGLAIAIRENGSGDIPRGSALCSAPIGSDDILIGEIEVIE